MQIHYFTLPQPMGIVPICLIASTPLATLFANKLFKELSLSFTVLM